MERNVLLLTATQALFQTTSIMVMTLSGLVGLMLAPDRSLATLPIALMVVATATCLIPASLLMQRYGRRTGFLVGTALGALAGFLGAYAITRDDFVLFVVANMLVGAYQAFAQFYRFAAADVANDAFRSRAISWVIAGGVAAAVLGPALVRYTQNLGTLPFVAPYIAMGLLALLAAALLTTLQIPPPTSEETQGPARPLLAIMRQPAFLTALTASAIGSAVMILVMTATPLAMQLCGLPVSDTATVIQWHVLGMFVPSFFTGHLIARFGILPVMAAGALLLGSHVLVALSGVERLHFLSGLTLLGVGWNFLFVSGTTLLTTTYLPAEKAKVQAMHDFLVFGAVSIASFSAGALLDAAGWDLVNIAAAPLLALMLGVWAIFALRLAAQPIN